MHASCWLQTPATSTYTLHGLPRCVFTAHGMSLRCHAVPYRPSSATDLAAPAGTTRFSASEGSVRRLDSGLSSSRSPSDSQHFRSRLSAFQRGTDSLKQELSFMHLPESFMSAVE